ncbi:hypothetical protein FGO68_gene15016 [Halteria grandinella]|uniref:Alsin helical array domain-containing protein n=1 Tax=Halteria grandinella TaxID=5974 RepID=A0A8J8NP25_HALGN|nr:hypothetical protein FGO68_gene15016 [Halteria grandinella]
MISHLQEQVNQLGRVNRLQAAQSEEKFSNTEANQEANQIHIEKDVKSKEKTIEELSSILSRKIQMLPNDDIGSHIFDTDLQAIASRVQQAFRESSLRAFKLYEVEYTITRQEEYKLALEIYSEIQYQKRLIKAQILFNSTRAWYLESLESQNERTMRSLYIGAFLKRKGELVMLRKLSKTIIERLEALKKDQTVIHQLSFRYANHHMQSQTLSFLYLEL